MGKFKDLTNQKFGELTVLEKDVKLSKEKKKTYWKCKCSCGREKSIRSDGLKKIQTCGECKNDLTNQTFGRLIVQKKGKKDKAGHQFWFCKCECGNIVEINGDNLRRGLTKSCGCLHKETIHKLLFNDITNQSFGKLTALSYETRADDIYWLCQCECGNQSWVKGNNLKNGHTQSCGCINYSIGEFNISNLLKQNNIKFITQKSYTDLPNLRFDFYLPDYNRLIEFDGIQHFIYTENWHQSKEEYDKARRRDEMKNSYALNNNIPLVRIPYTQRDNITIEMLLEDKYLVNKGGKQW